MIGLSLSLSLSHSFSLSLCNSTVERGDKVRVEQTQLLLSKVKCTLERTTRAFAVIAPTNCVLVYVSCNVLIC